jgi:plastocyanin
MKCQANLHLFAIISLFAAAQFAQAQPKTVVVEMFNFRFSPATVTVSVGDTVTWVNRQGSHDIQSNQPLFKSPPPPVQTFSHTFTQAGTFGYRCNPHAFEMTGTVIVQAGAKIPPTVRMTLPADRTMAQAPATLTLGATAADEDGSVVEIAFFRMFEAPADMEFLGVAAGRGNTLTLDDLPAGLYRFAARATDNDGETAFSDELEALVYDPFRLETITRTPGGESILTLATVPDGARFIPQASNDLAAWTDLPGSFLPNGEGKFQYQDSVANPFRFYRVRLDFPMIDAHSH